MTSSLGWGRELGLWGRWLLILLRGLGSRLIGLLGRWWWCTIVVRSPRRSPWFVLALSHQLLGQRINDNS